MIQLKTFVFNSFQVNSFVLFDESNEAVIIDAACAEDYEQQQIVSFLTEKKLKPVQLVNTHCHVDHLMGVKYLHSKYNIPFVACKDDYYLMANAYEQAMMFGLEMDVPPDFDTYIHEGDKLTFGNSALDILHVPGHSLGSLAFYSKEDKFVIVGDVLFNGSIGRTDLPGGDYDQIINSISKKLFTLPGDTVVFPGHGNSTTIQREHDTNPFFQ